MKIIAYILALCLMLLCQFSGIMLYNGVINNETISTIFGIGIFTLEYNFILSRIDKVTEDE